jgi:hypothetical protein
MAWAWVVLVLLVAVLPAAVWLRSRNLKPPREPYGSPIPRLAGRKDLSKAYGRAGEDDPREDGPSPNRSVTCVPGAGDISARH